VSREAPPRSARRPFPLRTGVAEVTRVQRLTPQMVRITLGGPALRDFPVEEPGEIVTLLWPAPGRDLVLPSGGWRFPPGVAEAQHARNYTVRRRRPGELDVDFVVHGDHGRASRWASAARPRHTVGFAGPRTHWTRPADPAWSLLVADETGLPALAAIVETLPAGHRALAVIEVADPGEEQAISSRADVDLHWRHRNGAPAGTTTLLPDTVSALDLPDGPGLVWGGGEAFAMRGVREQLGGRQQTTGSRVLGYWKHRHTRDWD
jgi:NADPH-dependent ferric siderophore reductase